MPSFTCTQCGATYAHADPTCAQRWHALLALDHSRQAPWGPLHGLAFATWTLQHWHGVEAAVLDTCWRLLVEIVVTGDAVDEVFAREREARAAGLPMTPSSVPRRTEPRPFDVTIRELSEFAADGYEDNLRYWARSTMEAWRGA